MEDGQPVSVESWNNPEKRVIVLRRAMRSPNGTVPALTLLLNPTAASMSFRLPPPQVPSRVLIDTDKPDAPERELTGDRIDVAARSAVVVLGIHQGAP